MVKKEVGNELPPVWKPEKEGESIEGIYTRRKQNVGENKANLYTLKVDGEIKAIWGSIVLDEKMDHVSEGDLITITYLGKEKKYHKYKVEVEEGEDSSE